MDEDEFDVGYRLLDDQLIDAEGRRCGRVDDVEFEGGVGDEPVLARILSGHGAWPARLPRRLRGLGRKLFGEPVLGETVAQIPWSAVDEAGTVVKLRAPARELGLDKGDDRITDALARNAPR